MAITKLAADVNVITALPDSPSVTDTELKASFDTAGNLVKTYVNDTLTTEIDTLLAGIDTSKRNTADVYKLLYDHSVLGSITDGSTKTIPGLSEYSLILIDHIYGAILLTMNKEKTRAFGISTYGADPNDYTFFMTLCVYCTISGDTITFNNKTLTHTINTVHNAGNFANLHSLHGLM